MPADLTKPFNESCCDGGATSGKESAQSCGCDLGLKPSPHYCERHTKARRDAQLMNGEPQVRYTYAQRLNSETNPVQPTQLQKHLNEVVNRTWNRWGRCDTHEKEVMNAVLGLAGEAGESADVVKKMFFHSAKKDKEEQLLNLKKELGDVYFYLLKLQELFGITTDEVLQLNREKLLERHPTK